MPCYCAPITKTFLEGLSVRSRNKQVMLCISQILFVNFLSKQLSLFEFNEMHVEEKACDAKTSHEMLGGKSERIFEYSSG